VRIAGWNTPTMTIPGNGTTPPPAARYEAESATISQGVVESNHAGFSGTGFVNLTGSFVQFTERSSPPEFPSLATETGDTWVSATIPVTLTAGANTIRATATTANGGPNVDYLEGQRVFRNAAVRTGRG
jgi:hypothetical protein